MNNTFASLRQWEKPFIFTSSQMAMGSTTYGILKQIGEKYTSALNGMIVRLWNVYGYETARTHVITDFIRMAREGRIDMRTNGKESRQFLYADDCCKCLEILMRNYESITIDVSIFKWTTIIKIADIIADYFNCSVYPNNVSDSNVEYIPSSRVLNYWQPETSIQEGIKKIINVDSRQSV
jgi:nucleoside-diphosphate-sugar epimerase